MRRIVAKGAQRLEAEMIKQMDERIRNIIRPKPRWMPGWVYRQLVHLIINMQKPL